MYYKLNEAQARLIAIDFEYLKDMPFSKSETKLVVEEIFADELGDHWTVYLQTYLGDKDIDAGHSNLRRFLWEYLSENNIDFNSEKYGLTSDNKM